MKNHIIIGLGGTGGKVMAALRRSIYELEGTKDPSSVALGYLYVDSSPEFMDMDGDLWRIPGDSLYIGDASTLNIKGQNLRSTLNGIASYPNIKPWIGDVNKWSHIQAAVDAGIGGQKRRLGRFVFACQAGEFVKKVDTQYHACTQKSKSSETVFHIVTGLAGGTGSGSVVDAIALIRKTYNKCHEHRIIVYALLPDQPAPWAKRGSAYHANGYAALTELNALAVGDYMPYDLTGSGERISLAGGALKATKDAPPFDGCYVFINENERGRVVEIAGKGAFYSVVGGFLYQKIVAVDDHAWQNKLARYETMENMKDDPSETDSNKPVRSMRFAAFGIKRVLVPDREIKEYLVFRSAEQALLQSLYNHLSDQGYEDTKAPDGPPSRDTKKREALRLAWKMSEDHLTQELPIVPLPQGGPEHKTYKLEWGMASQFVRLVKENNKNPLQWMSALNEICKKRYDKDFRGVGVEEFFRLRGREVNQQAREIVAAVEVDLFAKWEKGDWGLMSCQDALSTELEWLEQVRSENAKRIQKLKEVLGSAKTRSEMSRLLEANTREWPKIGPLSALLGKRDELLNAQASLYMESYRYTTMLLACEHAERLITVLAQQLRELLNTIGSVIALHLEVLDGSSAGSTYHGIRNHIADRCREDEDRGDLGAPVIKYYNPKDVHRFADRLFMDKETCKTFAANYRRAVTELIGAEKGFFNFNAQADRKKVEDAATDTKAERLVATQHDLLVNREAAVRGVLGENIVDKLSRDLAGKPIDLKKYCRDLMSQAGTFLKWDEAQRTAKEAGLKDENDQGETAVVIPPSPDAVAFRSDLEAAFGEASSSMGKFSAIDGRKPQEIVMISLRNLFPLRYSRNTVELREKYEEYLEGANNEEERARAIMELHGEQREFPPLFPMTPGEKDIHFRPYLLIASAAGIIMQDRDPSTGVDTLVLKTQTSVPKALGPTIDEILAKTTADVLASAKTEVKNRLASGSAAETAKIAGDLQARVANLDKEYSSVLDPKRTKQETALRTALEIIGGQQ
jgi:hypothetical protein